MTGAAQDDPAMSSVKKEEAGDLEWLPESDSIDPELLRLVKPEEDAPTLATGLIKQEAMEYEPPLDTELGSDCEVPARDLKKESCEGGYNDGLLSEWEAAGGQDGGMEFPSEPGGVSGMECKMEGEAVKEEPLDVLSKINEEEKRATSSEVTGSGMEHTAEEILAVAKDEIYTMAEVLPESNQLGSFMGVDQLRTACEADDDGGGGESMPRVFDESISLETKTVEVQGTMDRLAAPYIEKDGDDEQPPAGLEATVINNEGEFTVAAPIVSVESIPLETKTEEVQPTKDKIATSYIEKDDNGEQPPPGWEATVINNGGEWAAFTPPVSVEIIPLEIKAEEVGSPKDKLTAPDLENGDDDDGPPPGWEAAATKDTGAEETSVKQEKAKEKEEEEEEQEHILPRPPFPCKPPSPTTELGQVVCGSCRTLLSYAKGAKYVQCACCEAVSFVLEADQVGQVYCGSCSILLMYRFGSSAVKCSGCKFITQITPRNRRPLLSEQGVTLQSQLAQLRPRPTTNLAQ